jgi:hypothetical protein
LSFKDRVPKNTQDPKTAVAAGYFPLQTSSFQPPRDTSRTRAAQDCQNPQASIPSARTGPCPYQTGSIRDSIVLRPVPKLPCLHNHSNCQGRRCLPELQPICTVHSQYRHISTVQLSNLLPSILPWRIIHQKLLDIFKLFLLLLLLPHLLSLLDHSPLPLPRLLPPLDIWHC